MNIDPIQQPDGSMAFEHGGAPVDRVAFLNQLFDDLEKAHLALEQELIRALKLNGLLPENASFELGLGGRFQFEHDSFGLPVAQKKVHVYSVRASNQWGSHPTQVTRQELMRFVEFKPGKES